MSNFEFVRSTWPQVFADCSRAEGYLASDPRSTCFYARRVAEHLVGLVYDVDGLKFPYKDDLAARIGEPAFGNKVGDGIRQKLTLIRKLGNRAVHDVQPIPAQAAVQVVRELHHVVIWTAFRYSGHPDTVPTGAVFDPALAGKRAPLTREDVAKLAKKFADQDAEHAKELQDRDDLAAAKDAEIAALRAQIAAAQTAAPADDRDYSEAQTRTLIIDELLREAGWSLTGVDDREYALTGMPGGGGGRADYVLWGSDGLPLAVVEAKRTTRSEMEGQRQAELYADALAAMHGRRPVIFYTNGFRTWLWDDHPWGDEPGYAPRAVEGFLTADELERMIRRRTSRGPLASAPVDTAIVERHYQQRAIRAVGEAFAKRQRAALLVMATGAGKTRTVIALVDQLMKAGWVKRVLFLADRNALVDQAAKAFRAHLPSVTTVDLTKDRAGEGRVYASTYPTMLGLINSEVDGGVRRFAPGHFDLVIIDEAHRSVYQRYRTIFSWFDSLLVGLTATPKDEVDRNTYDLFGLEAGVPTDFYDLDTAVAEGYLVPPVGIAQTTTFLSRGVHYDDLSDEDREAWDTTDWNEDGDVPDSVPAADVNHVFMNDDTVDKVLATLMEHGHKVAGGDRLGKTIIFARNQRHAEFVQQRFDANYPEYGGTFARTITHSVSYAQTLIDDFAIPGKAPHIAVSVDMLDTGIDVPDVVNLVFFKQVRSKAKFWQMIGRGTRKRPDLFGPGQDKANFYVFDFCGNLEYFRQNLPDSGGSVQKSLGQRLFEARLGLVSALDGTGPEPAEVGGGEATDGGLRADLAWGLHEIVLDMNVDNVLVRPQREWVERYSTWDAWQRITLDEAGELARHLAGLPSARRDDDEDAKRFDLVFARLQLARLEGDVAVFERLRTQVVDIATTLLGQTTIPSVKAQEQVLEQLAGDEWWVDVTLPLLEHARRRVRSLVRLLPKGSKKIVYTNFADELGEGTVVDLPGVTPGTNWERFRAKAGAYLREQEQQNLVLQRLRRNIPLTPADLTELEALLVAAGGGDAEIARAREESHGLGVFVRQLVGLDRAAATAAFDEFLAEGSFRADQLRFVQLVVTHLTANGVMEAGLLWDPPFTDSAPDGPQSIFSDDQVGALVAVLDAVRGRALPDVTVA